MNIKNHKLTGYSIYNPILSRKKKLNPLINMGLKYPELPNKKFEVIYADPPWDYGGKSQFDKTLNKKENPEYKKKIFLSTSSFKYPTMKLRELINIPVQTIADNNCILFMWSTNPQLEQSIQLGKSWGFEYKTVAFVWNKMKHNPGQYTMSYCELCLLFKKGKIPKRNARNIKQLVNIPRKEHSKKPNEIRKYINKIFPSQNKIELFARSKNDGWESWGLDILKQ
jgi:N6-adenosine-specific RNA methylase IME4